MYSSFIAYFSVRSEGSDYGGLPYPYMYKLYLLYSAYFNPLLRLENTF